MHWRAPILAAVVVAATAVNERPAAAAQTPADGIWISRAELLALPTSGAAWTQLRSAAAKTCTAPDLADQDDPTNVCVMAKALVAARTGDPVLRDQVMAVLATIADGGPYVGRALALGRELAAYVIAADLIELKTQDAALDQRFRTRLRVLLTTPTTGGPANLIKCHEERPNNWGAHCGDSRVAVAAYLGDDAEIARAATVFKGWLGDRATYAGFDFGDLAWQCDPTRPVPINPVGCVKLGQSLDGVLPDDQRRASGFTWPPPHENYVYEALQGALAQAVLLNRAGYDVFEWESQALRRAFQWLHMQANFPAANEDIWEAHVINHYYGTTFPAAVPTSPGKNVGWTDWTHTSIAVPASDPMPTPAPTPPPPDPVPTPGFTPPPDHAAVPVPVPTPSPVGEIKAITFEAGTLIHATSGASSVSGGVSLESAAQLKGLFAARVSGGSAYLEEKFGASSDLSVSFYVRLDALPAGDVRLVLISNAGVSVGNLVLRSNGRLRLRVDSTTVGPESQPLVAGQLYRIGLRQRAGTGANAGLDAFLASGDAPFAAPFSATTTGSWTTLADRVRLGATTSAIVNAVIDDARLNAGALPAPSN